MLNLRFRFLWNIISDDKNAQNKKNFFRFWILRHNKDMFTEKSRFEEKLVDKIS
jgi:hypothetical protein